MIRSYNRGSQPVSQGIPVSFFTDDPANGGLFICTATTTTRLNPGQGEEVSCSWGSAPNQATTVQEVLEMRQQSIDNSYYGPWILYFSPAWGAYMDADYSANKGDNTLRERLEKIDGITAVKQADYLTGTKTMILVQQTSDVARIVNGMDITTVQWESHGGMQLNFKVMAILVPQLRDDYGNQTGIVHGS